MIKMGKMIITSSTQFDRWKYFKTRGVDNNRRGHFKCLFHLLTPLQGMGIISWVALLSSLHAQDHCLKFWLVISWNLLSFLPFREGRCSRLTDWPFDRGDQQIVAGVDLDQVFRWFLDRGSYIMHEGSLAYLWLPVGCGTLRQLPWTRKSPSLHGTGPDICHGGYFFLSRVLCKCGKCPTYS